MGYISKIDGKQNSGSIGTNGSIGSTKKIVSRANFYFQIFYEILMFVSFIELVFQNIHHIHEKAENYINFFNIATSTAFVDALQLPSIDYYSNCEHFLLILYFKLTIDWRN